MTAGEKCPMDSNHTVWHHTARYSELIAWKQMAGLGHLSLVKPPLGGSALTLISINGQSPAAKCISYNLK